MIFNKVPTKAQPPGPSSSPEQVTALSRATEGIRHPAHPRSSTEASTPPSLCPAPQTASQDRGHISPGCARHPQLAQATWALFQAQGPWPRLGAQREHVVWRAPWGHGGQRGAFSSGPGASQRCLRSGCSLGEDGRADQWGSAHDSVCSSGSNPSQQLQRADLGLSPSSSTASSVPWAATQHLPAG